LRVTLLDYGGNELFRRGSDEESEGGRRATPASASIADRFPIGEIVLATAIDDVPDAAFQKRKPSSSNCARSLSRSSLP